MDFWDRLILKVMQICGSSKETIKELEEYRNKEDSKVKRVVTEWK